MIYIIIFLSVFLILHIFFYSGDTVDVAEGDDDADIVIEMEIDGDKPPEFDDLPDIVKDVIGSKDEYEKCISQIKRDGQ